MTIKATVIEASRTPAGIIGWTFVLEYPAFMHQDFMAHREFSRNASSTRAIPINKMLDSIRKDIAMPLHWGANQGGMVADIEVTGSKRRLGRFFWKLSAHTAMVFAGVFRNIGLHKQVSNMILWPYMHFRTIMTTTNLDNFDKLRRHRDARPEMIELAKAIRNAAKKHLESGLVNDIGEGEWHLPFVTSNERDYLSIEDQLKVSVARCARGSYNPFGEERLSTAEEDQSLYEKLIISQPLHASPTEHQFKPDFKTIIQVRQPGKRVFVNKEVWNSPELHGNLKGVIQHRKLLAGEFTDTNGYECLNGEES